MARPSLLWLTALVLAPLSSADTIDDLVNESMKSERIPGLALAIIEKGKVREIRCYGLANLETQTPVTPQTVFKIASMSKAFAAGAAMLLIEEGKLSLDDRVVDLLPDAPKAWSEIRVRHLLSHTSGIPDTNQFDFNREYTERQYLALFSDLPLDSAPGEVFRYNNFAYAALGLVVGKAAGKSVREFVSERILEPLGMTSAHYYDLPKIVPQRANGYQWRNGGYVNPNPMRPQVYDGSGGLLVSMEDYVKWDAALYQNRPLSETIRQTMWTPYLLANGKPATYGFGWFVAETDKRPELYHSGSTQGFTSFIIRGMDDGLTVIVFRNGVGNGATKLGRDLLRAARSMLSGRD
jgi:CubicO group peptidase (beta-lactamase class C family)